MRLAAHCATAHPLKEPGVGMWKMLQKCGTHATATPQLPTATWHRPGIWTSAVNRLIGEVVQSRRAFSWLKVATTAFTFKTLLRHYAKWVLTPRSLNVKLGPRRNYHKGRAAIRHYANQTARPL